MLRKLLMSCGLAALSGIPAATAAQEPAKADRPPRAAMSYAQDYGVSLDEAIRRLAFQHDVGKLDEQLSRGEADTFAGLYIEHRPVYRVVVKFTRDPPGLLRKYTQDPRFVPEAAQRSYRQLLEAQERTYRALKARGMESSSGPDVVTNSVEFYVPDEARARAFQAADVANIPSFVTFKRARSMEHRREATIEGGRNLIGQNAQGDCTTGFTVYDRSNSANRYITTAGHCPRPLRYMGVELPEVGTRYGGKYDFRWMSTPGFSRPTNVIYEGTPYLYAITLAMSYQANSIGARVCKYGSATGFTCGNIVQRDYNAFGTPGFIRVRHPYDYDLSSYGDSGGPWYDDYNSAYGIHTDSADAVDPNQAIYMPVDYVWDHNLAVLTSP